MDLYINRFYLVHQRLRRKKGWYRPAIVDASTDSFVEVIRLLSSSPCTKPRGTTVKMTDRHCDGSLPSKSQLTKLKAMLGVLGETRID